ncbi:transcriptional regulator [Salmonella enterica subsp. enterica serovar Uzaramo]|nr:transcriptional regulator [Salmonella enterica subsp. enterica serovar Uzaramo]EHP5748840.1 Rha family transcriptional regulator [Salmonella enterica]EHP5913293.1 Rha family transcriptional regulator [Salmonella enterica]
MKQLNLTTATDSTLEIINGVPMMGSREIAKFTDKEHGKICRDIRVMLEKLYGISDADSTRNPDLAYLTNHGVICRQYDTNNPNAWEYLLNHEHSDCLVAGYDPVRRMAIIKLWRALEREISQLQIATPQPTNASANENILSLARVVAEATASATMKALMEATGIQALTGAQVLPHIEEKQRVQEPAQPEAEEPEIHDYPLDPSYEFIPIVRIAWNTTFSDAACRRLIDFAGLPVRKLEGVRGLCVHMESFMDALKALIDESTPPMGKLKRWQHPYFGGFALRKDPKEIFGEAE